MKKFLRHGYSAFKVASKHAAEVIEMQGSDMVGKVMMNACQSCCLPKVSASSEV